MKEQIASWKREIQAWRHEIHKHPELAFEEQRTADLVSEKLESFGVQVHRGLGRTGVVGTIRAGTSSRAIGLRADMDALPIHEANDFAYRSTVANRMHACGHDGHTAMLLGAAKYLAKTRQFNGTVHFIFQPAEEDGCGALAMVEDGLFERFSVDSVYGMHNWPGMDVGSFGIKSGAMMASFDVFDIEIIGVGTHAALPHTGTDPVVVAGHMITALQSVVSRNLDPIGAGVVSVTQLEAGDAYNVIPEKAILRGSTRALGAELRRDIENRVKETAHGICAALGARCDVHYAKSHPPLINTAEETNHAVSAAMKLVGSDKVDTGIPPVMGSEDFSYLLQRRPGAYIFLGNGETQGSCMLHNAHYDFNDDAIETGVGYWCTLTESLLGV